MYMFVIIGIPQQSNRDPIIIELSKRCVAIEGIN